MDVGRKEGLVAKRRACGKKEGLMARRKDWKQIKDLCQKGRVVLQEDGLCKFKIEWLVQNMNRLITKKKDYFMK